MGQVVKKVPTKRKPMRRRASGEGLVRVGRRTADVIDDPSSVADWDDEELKRGQRRDKNGHFRGRPPSVVPAELHRELVRRQMKFVEDELRDNVGSAVNELVGIMKSPAAEDRDRIAAIKIIMERVMGKEPISVDVHTEEPPWMAALMGGIVGDEDQVGIESPTDDDIEFEED